MRGRGSSAERIAGAAALTAMLLMPVVCLAAKPAEEGSLVIGSEPTGANVDLDGKPRGRTPLTLGPLLGGEHRLTLVAYGHLENSQLVTVVPGQTTTVQVHLTPNREISGATGASGPSGTTAAPPRATPRPAPVAAPGDRPAQVRGGGHGLSTKKLVMVGAPVLLGGGAAAYLVANRNTPPTVGAITVQPAGIVGLASVTTFHFSSDAKDANNDPLQYLWDFADGTSSTEAAPTRIYDRGATYTVRVTVSDKKATATASTQVSVASLGGFWNGTLAGGTSVTLSLEQSGANLSGSLRYNANGFARAVRGQVSESRTLALTFEDAADARLTGTVSGDAKSITGKIEVGSASVTSFTVGR